MSLRFSAVLVLLFGNSLAADVYTFECTSVPDKEDGWILVQVWCDPEPQWIEEGRLYQHNELCEGWNNGQFISQKRLIGDLSNTQSWFAEWVMITDGISEELIYGAPAMFIVFDGNAMDYHFTISDDRVRFIRDLGPDPVLYFDIEPGIFHTFRLELYGPELGQSYVVYIDGEIVDMGVPEGPLFNPPYDPSVHFRAKARLVPSTTQWEYMRWGSIPIVGSGDFDNNLEIDSFDLYFFQECLTTEAGGWAGCAWADMDEDGGTDCDDWFLFLAAWTDRADPPAMPQCVCVPPDLDCNGSVGPFDLALLLGSWGPCPDPEDCPADLDGNGEVNAMDLAILLGSWG